MRNKIFVLGATGVQGSNIAKRLLSESNNVVTLSRSNEQDKAISGLEIIPGELDDKLALSNALQGVDKAVFTFPLIFDIEKAIEYTRNFIEIAEKQGVSLVVFNSSFDLPNKKTGLLALDLKIAINSLFEKSNLNVITLMPDIYIDNLVAPWALPLILEKGIMPYPVESEKQVPWISHSNLARFVSSAINKPELAGEVLPIGGNIYTGEDIAQAISSEINKPVNFISVAPDAFEQQISPGFGALAGKEISNLYRYVATNREELITKNFKKSQELLAVTPESLTDWVGSIKWS